MSGMTVGQLIAELHTMDPELVVYYEDAEYGYERILEARVHVNAIPRYNSNPSPPWDGKPFVLLVRSWA